MEEYKSVADNQSNKVRKKCSFKATMFLSPSSKVRAFLSLQIHHIKNCWCTLCTNPVYMGCPFYILFNKIFTYQEKTWCLIVVYKIVVSTLNIIQQVSIYFANNYCF